MLRILALLSFIALVMALPTPDDVVPESLEETEEIATAFPWTPACTAGVGEGDAPNVFVDAVNGKDYKTAGKKMRGTREKPYQSLAYAVSRREHHRETATGDCVTINLMAGTYRNEDYGTEGGGKEFILDMDGVQDMIIKPDDEKTGATATAKVLLEFDGPGGFVGGSTKEPVTDVEIYGLEIAGPNQQITFDEAMEFRIKGSQKIKGQGISIWNGHKIWMHDMKVHDTPGAGMRVNNADYLVVEDSEVYSTTWWSRSAESAIVFAQSKNIDNSTKTKMIMRNNKVYDNMNKVPYFNPNYAWNYYPIGKQYCVDEKEGGACETLYQCCNKDDTSCCNNQEMKNSCPWQCRYGKASQDYVIDGQGVYVTRNSDTYHSGTMELSGNVAYKNGINGLVFHRTYNGLVKKNIIFDNGQLPKDGETTEATCEKPSDPDCWKIPLIKSMNPDKKKTGRQPYSGLTLSNSKNVKLWSNTVKAKYASDKAYEFEVDAGDSFALAGGKNNKDCQGKVSKLIESAVSIVKDGSNDHKKYCAQSVFDSYE